MLALTRRVGQKILILERETNELIAEILIEDISENQVRVGVGAEPEQILIHREEVHLRILKEAEERECLRSA